MASPFDPYRVLGLRPDASLAEIKQAYRRLAKAYHPDWAGPSATPRFLAIQEAYDALTAEGARGGSAGRTAWRGDRGRDGGTGAGGPGGRGPGARGATGGGFRPRTGGSPEPGPAPFGPRRRGSAAPEAGGWWQRRSRRPPNRATLGSTTYDDAGEPEPEWEGASWYGQATGTYWTINPREYADPRKHGPEYQARARRGRGREGIDAAAEPDEPEVEEAEATGEAAEEAAGDRASTPDA